MGLSPPTPENKKKERSGSWSKVIRKTERGKRRATPESWSRGPSQLHQPSVKEKRKKGPDETSKEKKVSTKGEEFRKKDEDPS